MIRYALRCTDGHDFESWFQSAQAFDSLKASGHLACAVCGGAEVEKALMAPKVGAKAVAAPEPANADRPLAKPATKMEVALAELRRKVEAHATYVGGAFAKEARAIHDGEKPDRPIYGEATPAEARSLVEDGVPIAPLPFRPKAKAN